MQKSLSIKLLLIPIIASFICAGCQSQPEFKEQLSRPAVPVIASIPFIKTITFNIESLGTLLPSAIVEIKPQVNGILKTALVHEGDLISVNMPLFEIDPYIYEIRVQEAQAQLTSDHTTNNALEKKLVRYRQLVQKDLLSQTEWEDLEASKERAVAALALSEARLAIAKRDLSNCTIRSPIDGKIGKIAIHAGNHVCQNQTQSLSSVSNLKTLTVEFSITEKEFSKISKQSQEVEILPIGSSNERSKGVITFIDHTFDQKTGLMLLHATIDNSKELLHPGQAVRVFIPIKTKVEAMLIPQKAIRYSQEGPFVYVVQNDNTIKKAHLELGKEYGTDQIIKKGIESTDRIVHDGHLRISEGSLVDVQS